MGGETVAGQGSDSPSTRKAFQPHTTTNDVGSPRELRLVLVAGIAGTVAFGLQWAGLQPVVVVVIALATWFLVLARRLGPAFAAGLVPIAWLSTVFVVFTVTPALGVDPRVASNAVLVATTFGAVLLVLRVPVRYALRPHLPILLASLAGGCAWMAAMAWGLASGAGGGLSWAMYRDSTMDLWSSRSIIDYRGVGSSVNTFLFEPLNPVGSSSLVSPEVAIDASPHVAQAFLMGHAFYWSMLIVFASLVAGLCVATIVGQEQRWLQVVGASSVSLVLVLQPVSGVVAELGQSNVHLVSTVVMATVLAALTGREYPAVAMSVVLAGAALLMASWLPFTIVPVAVLIPLWRQVSVRRLPRDHVLPRVLPGAALLLWCFVNYGLTELRGALAGATSGTATIVEATTHSHGSLWTSYTNPYSVPLVASLLVVGIVCAFFTLTSARWRSGVAGVAITALGAGLVPTALLVGSSTEALGYFPAKQLFITAICLLPLAVGAALGATTLGGVRAAFAILGLVAVIATATIAPTRDGISRLTLTPLVIATGSHFGSDSELADLLIESADPTELRLPWRFNPEHDGTIALAMSSFAPDRDAILLQPTRAVLRTYRNDFRAEVACDLADADPRPLVLTTTDPTLAAELAELCPDAGIRVEAVTTSD